LEGKEWGKKRKPTDREMQKIDSGEKNRRGEKRAKRLKMTVVGQTEWGCKRRGNKCTGGTERQGKEGGGIRH